MKKKSSLVIYLPFSSKLFCRRLCTLVLYIPFMVNSFIHYLLITISSQFPAQALLTGLRKNFQRQEGQQNGCSKVMYETFKLALGKYNNSLSQPQKVKA